MKPWFVGLAILGITAGLGEGKSHEESFSKEGLFKADVNTLTDTRLLAHPSLPWSAKENTLWCGTLQLAWNQAVGLVGEKLAFPLAPASVAPEIQRLNQMDFQGTDLDPKSYVAIADFERNQVEAKISAALQKTFHGAASPEMIPHKPMNPGPDDFVAYAYLYKNLAFAIPFGEIPVQRFNDTYVKAFGFNPEMHLLTAPEGQVLIYDYKSPDDFIIELKSKSIADQLILAKVDPGTTLAATTQTVLQRMKIAPPENTFGGDALAVPKLNFDLREDFKELESLVLQPGPSAKIHQPLMLSKVQQLVRFQLNEKGAVLKPEATVVAVATAMMTRHRLIFDRPFLLLMKQKNAPLPYLELWVANRTLLIPSSRPPGA